MKSSKAYKDKQGQVRPLQEWNLSNLIDVNVELELIGKTAKQASCALKEFRNFIHPYNVRKQSDCLQVRRQSRQTGMVMRTEAIWSAARLRGLHFAEYSPLVGVKLEGSRSWHWLTTGNPGEV